MLLVFAVITRPGRQIQYESPNLPGYLYGSLQLCFKQLLFLDISFDFIQLLRVSLKTGDNLGELKNQQPAVIHLHTDAKTINHGSYRVFRLFKA